jgi:hypothetical protein
MQRYRGHSSDTGDTGDTLLESGVMPSPRRRQPIRRPAPHSPLPTPNSAVGILPAVRPSPRRCSALRGLEAHATIHPHGTLWRPHHHFSHGAVGILPAVVPCSEKSGWDKPIPPLTTHPLPLTSHPLPLTTHHSPLASDKWDTPRGTKVGSTSPWRPQFLKRPRCFSTAWREPRNSLRSLVSSEPPG